MLVRHATGGGEGFELDAAERFAGQAAQAAQDIGPADADMIEGLAAGTGEADQVALLAEPSRGAAKPLRGLVGGHEFLGQVGHGVALGCRRHSVSVRSILVWRPRVKGL